MAPRGAAADHAKSASSRRNRKEPPSKEAQRDRIGQHKAKVQEDEQRSDWEGMAPKPEQPSDDVAAPGQLPVGHS